MSQALSHFVSYSSLRSHLFGADLIMCASAKFTSGEAASRGLSSTAVLITGHPNEFTRGVLTALASLVVVGILALLVAFGVSVLF